jgi:hypothetical protein
MENYSQITSRAGYGMVGGREAVMESFGLGQKAWGIVFETMVKGTE